ncbi:MAG: pilus assembly protein PilM [Vulcanimicrobiaceae bacterium]
MKLPLGVDLGSTRIRVAALRTDRGAPVIERLGGVDVAGETDAQRVAALRALLVDLGVRERRCVIGIGEPDALLREIVLPPMSRAERGRTAQYEATRYITYPVERARVALLAIDRRRGAHALGIVRRLVLAERVALVRAAGLRVTAVDHDSLALRRALPAAGAALDVGAATTRFHVLDGDVPRCAVLDGGGAQFTTAIARSLSLDTPAAERRKRAHGLGGSADVELAASVRAIAQAVVAARASCSSSIDRFTLVGNGVRLIGFADQLERATGCRIAVAAAVAPGAGNFPADVVGSAATDVALAIGLALWSCADAQAA